MSELTFEYLGQPLTRQKVVPGNVITALSLNCYQYKRWKLNYDAGAHEVVAGDWLYGATNYGVAKVVSVTLTGGAWTSNAYGYFIVDSKVGTFADNEAITVAAQTGMCNVNEPAFGDAETLQDDYPNKGMEAKCALVIVYANTALVDTTGGKPDQSRLIGDPMVANSSLLLRDINEIKKFYCVDYTSGSASIVQVKFFF